MLEQSKAEQFSEEQLERELLKRDKHLEYEDERELFESYCQNRDLFPDEFACQAPPIHVPVSPIVTCGHFSDDFK